jgi:hypothetical protein
MKSNAAAGPIVPEAVSKDPMIVFAGSSCEPEQQFSQAIQSPR